MQSAGQNTVSSKASVFGLLDEAPMTSLHYFYWLLASGGTLLDGLSVVLLGATFGTFVVPQLQSAWGLVGVLALMAFVSVAGIIATAGFAHVVDQEDRLEESTDEPAIPSKTQLAGERESTRFPSQKNIFAVTSR